MSKDPVSCIHSNKSFSPCMLMKGQTSEKKLHLENTHVHVDKASSPGGVSWLKNLFVLPLLSLPSPVACLQACVLCSVFSRQLTFSSYPSMLSVCWFFWTRKWIFNFASFLCWICQICRIDQGFDPHLPVWPVSFLLLIKCTGQWHVLPAVAQFTSCRKIRVIFLFAFVLFCFFNLLMHKNILFEL